MKYSETTLQTWTVPLSSTEEERVENTIKMIKDAIRSHNELSLMTYEIFAQGSYANNTNVRQNSDIDICVMLTSTFYGNYEDGTKASDYGFSDGSISFSDFRKYVIEALRDKFGDLNVEVGNKCIDIDANSYHVNADVVPAFQYRDYKIIHSKKADRFVEGIKFFTQNNERVINYPKEHLKNGREKNNATNYQYKKLVRIMKHIRNNMVGEGLIDGEIITSFLVECLVWNVKNTYITKHDSWNETLQDSIAFLWNEINDGHAKDWGEVSEMLYLFHSGRKWNQDSAKQFLGKMYSYLEY